MILTVTLSEHSVFSLSESFDVAGIVEPASALHYSNGGCKVCEVINNSELKTHYYIGTDWLIENKLALYVEPKLNQKMSYQTDYLQMLFLCLKHEELFEYTQNLYEIKFNSPFIPIKHEKDIITPLLIIHFLQVLKVIIKRGLRKSYYKVERNLNSRIKGKIIVSKNLKENIIRNNLTKIFCGYEEYGSNIPENKILKKTLLFVQKYLKTFPENFSELSDSIHCCISAFNNVDDNISAKEIINIPRNAFFSQYNLAIHLAQLILQRFSYNINIIQQENTILTPPFWIDMAKLFELYVLGLLKDSYKNKILYQTKAKYGNPDYLLIDVDKPMIIDAKYKTIYNVKPYEIDDIRQLSGYARDIKILKKLNLPCDKVVPCLIIYPSLTSNNIPLQLSIENFQEITSFKYFYKLGVPIPQKQ